MTTMCVNNASVTTSVNTVKSGSNKMKPSFYDGTKLLSLLDADGNKPEIYLCTSNRSAGKTTYFGRKLVRNFKAKGDKFGLIYRFNYELDSIADKFFKDIGSLFFKDDVMTSRSLAKGIFHELYLNGVPCGYAISINSADQLKKYSHLFSDIKQMMFDEFQSETNHYCSDEVSKFISIHNSIARGQGQQSRYVPVYMVGNPVSLLNPYYVSLGISSRIAKNTRFLKGKGWVLEQGYVESASSALKASGFNKAFINESYSQYAQSAKYLNDDESFIEKPEGFSKYVCTLKYRGKLYGIREYAAQGYCYCDDKADETFPIKIVVTTDDHDINYLMLKNNDLFLSNYRYLFERGCFRFKNLQCKEALLSALSY